MFRIALVIPTVDAIGGAEKQVLLLAVELRRRGHAVAVLALSGTGGLERKRLSAADVEFVELGMRKAWVDPRGWRRYLRWARKFQPEMVHAHLPHASWFSRWVRLLRPVRVVIDTVHTSNPGGQGRRLGYRGSAWLSNDLTCVSEAVAAAAASITGKGRLTVQPNCVVMPDDEFVRKKHSETFESGDLQERVFRWVAVGRLERVKDYPTLLRAFALLPEGELTIAGAGSEEAALRELAVELGIAGRVVFAGFQTDVEGLLGAASGFVLSSLWEGLPVSVLEAQAARLPVVATDGKGTRDAMISGTTGLIVPVGDVAALANAMRSVSEMPGDDRRAMGEAGRAFVQENFSLPVVVDRWEALYSRLMAEHPRAKRWA